MMKLKMLIHDTMMNWKMIPQISAIDDIDVMKSEDADAPKSVLRKTRSSDK
jgi:hypothetical protein